MLVRKMLCSLELEHQVVLVSWKNEKYFHSYLLRRGLSGLRVFFELTNQNLSANIACPQLCPKNGPAENVVFIERSLASTLLPGWSIIPFCVSNFNSEYHASDPLHAWLPRKWLTVKI